MNREGMTLWLKLVLGVALAAASVGALLLICFLRGGSPTRTVRPSELAAERRIESSLFQPVSGTKSPKTPDLVRSPAAAAQTEPLDDAVWRAIEAFLAGTGPADMEAIVRFLSSMTVPAGWTHDRITARKDEVLDRLSCLANPPPDMMHRLATVSADPAADPAARDYVLQYFRDIYTARSTASGKWSAGPEAAIIRTAWSQALSAPSGSLAGTALLAWQAMAGDHPEFDPAVARVAALRLLDAPKASDAMCTAALAVCAQASVTEAVPRARHMAETGATLPLRAAAIAAVGALGGKNDLPWLEAFRRDRAPASLEPACAAAMVGLRKRWDVAGE